MGSYHDMKDYEKLMKASLDLDPWCRSRGLAGYVEEIIIETEELRKAIDNDDSENIKEELGDVLLDWAHACIMAGEKHGFSMQDVIEASAEKIRRRKPYLAQGKKVSLDEAKGIWARVKREERD